jgi:hypothetical protein
LNASAGPARFGAENRQERHIPLGVFLRDHLKATLAGIAPEPGNGTPPTAAEVAERIKTLKAQHTIEAAPERAGNRRLDAEEPVTARIRRRTAATPPADSVPLPDDARRAFTERLAGPPVESPSLRF